MAKKEISDFNKLVNLEDYSGFLGSSYQYKINLLDKLIGNAHHLSSGEYKERLLFDFIKEYLPKRYSVGTGFILFAPVTRFDFDCLDKYEISTQLDIIIYDDFYTPVIFRDKNFVVLRPESVKCIIEVKGSLSSEDIRGGKKGIGVHEKCAKLKHQLFVYTHTVYNNILNTTKINKRLKIHIGGRKKLSFKYYLFCWDIYRNKIGTKGITDYLKTDYATNFLSIDKYLEKNNPDSIYLLQQHYNKGKRIDCFIDGVYRYNQWCLLHEQHKDTHLYNKYKGNYKASDSNIYDITMWDILYNIMFFLEECEENIAYDNLKIKDEIIKTYTL